jgi:transposase-like protein
VPERHAEIRKQVEAALTENADERRRLGKALLYLDMGITPSLGSPLRPAKANSAKRRSGKRRRRARPGQRTEEFLSAVQGQSGITVAEIARKIGVSPPNALYALAKRLVTEGKLTKSGSGYMLKASESGKAPTPKAKRPKARRAKRKSR